MTPSTLRGRFYAGSIASPSLPGLRWFKRSSAKPSGASTVAGRRAAVRGGPGERRDDGGSVRAMKKAAGKRRLSNIR